MTLRFVAIAGALIALCGQSMAGQAAFVESPAVAKEITNGIDDAFACTMKYVAVPQAWSCAIGGERIYAQTHPDHLAYDVGYYFQSWHDLDMDWSSDQELAKTGQAPATGLNADERYVRAIFRLYRDAKNRLGIADARLLAISTMNPEAKAQAAARLQFWAKRM